MNNTKSAKIDLFLEYAFTLELEEDRSIFESILPGSILLSDTANRSIKARICKVGQSNFRTARQFLCRAAAVFLIVCTIAATVSFSIPSVRAAAWNLIETFFERYIGISWKIDSEHEYPVFLEERYSPSIPQQWTSEIIFEDSRLFLCEITGTQQESLTFEQQVYDETYITQIDNDPISIDTVYLHHVPASLYTYDDGTMILFWVDRYAFTMISYNISRDDLISLAESVCPK